MSCKCDTGRARDEAACLIHGESAQALYRRQQRLLRACLVLVQEEAISASLAREICCVGVDYWRRFVRSAMSEGERGEEGEDD